MVQEITEIKEIVKGLDSKLDNVIECKADKSEVATLTVAVKDLESWKIKTIAIGSALLFIVTFFKDIIINFFKSN